MYRLVLPQCPGHIHDNDTLATAINGIDAAVEKDVGADFLAVVGVIPYLLHQLFGVSHALDMVLAIIILFHAKQNAPAIRVGKCGITLPKGTGYCTFCLLELDLVSLGIGYQPQYIIICNLFHSVSSGLTAF